MPNAPFAKLWNGATVYIIGGGSSLKRAAGLSIEERDAGVIYPALRSLLAPLREKRVIGVNNAFLLGGELVDACWYGDDRWARHHRDALNEFTGLIATCAPNGARRVKNLWFARENKFGIHTKNDRIFWNHNSGVSAINFAYHMGAAKVVLIGFDMTIGEDGQTSNWHHDHTWECNKNPYVERFLPPLGKVAKDAAMLHLEIINANMDSVIPNFPKITLEEALSGN